MNQNNLIPFKKGFDERRQNGRKAGDEASDEEKGQAEDN